jgi:hypothetical protein
MNNTNTTPADSTREQVEEYSKFWNVSQIKKMISEVDKRDPKSTTTLDCIGLLTEMTHDAHEIDPTRVFSIMCVLNKGPIFSTVDPHIDIQKPESTLQKETSSTIFTMTTIDEELMKLLSE